MTFVYAAHPHDLPLPEVTALVGGKAANLGVMARELDLPVPPGLVITTAACRAYLAGGWPAGLDEEIRAGMAEVERQVGRRFGDADDPLLVSVRSGAPVSMPGMMDTILDLGLTDATEAGLARVSGDAAFARDCHDRLRTMFRDIVGQDAPDDPWRQLRLAVEAVFRSWNSDRARAYRRREGIPDDAGTGVTIQAMVFGNRGSDSATGVVFTRNPATGEAGLYGDVMFGAQGEDVVAGTHRTEPLASLDQRLPAVAAELRRDGARLEALLPRPVRHRVHHRGGPPVAPPGARRQAEPAGGAADRPRDGPRRALPALAPRGRRAGRAAARRSAARRDRPASGRRSRWRPGWPRRRAWRPARSSRTPRPPSGPPTRDGRRSWSGARPRPMTSTAWPARRGS